MAEKNALEFAVLSDEGNRVARQFGLVFPLAARLKQLYTDVGGIELRVYNGNDSWELPMPGTFVIARERTVQLASVEADYTRRLEPAAIIEGLQQLR